MKTQARRRLLRFLELVVLCFLLNLAQTALSAETPFGFKIGDSVRSQLKSCSSTQPTQPCFEVIDSLPTVSTYKLHHEKNILGGINQQVYIVEKNDVIEQVQVVFSKHSLAQVSQILLTQFGPPQIQSSQPIWIGTSEYQANLSHWLLEDGVVSLQDTLKDQNLACAVIRTQSDFDRSFSAGTANVTAMQNI